jgi:hypothetical protein
VSSTNCCDVWTVHLFRRTADGTFAPRREVKYARPGVDPLLQLAERSRHRPHPLDWDRDGRTDLVLTHPLRWYVEVGAGPLGGKDQVEVTRFDLPKVPGVHPHHSDIAHADGDGPFDLLMAACHLKTPDKGPWLYDVYWFRNAARRGGPRFEAPVKLLSVPEPWEFNGFAVVPRGRPGRQDLVVGLTRNWDRKPDTGWTVDSQLWLYRRRSV